MIFFPTFLKAWNAVRRIITARFEAAYQRWGERSWLPSSVQDAHLDVDKATRVELVRRHRYWVKNNPIVNRIRSLFIQFSVGVEGLQCTPNASDENWNLARATGYELWSQHPEINTDLTMGQLHVQWAGALFDDGEIFILKISDRGRPMIQTIAAGRVETPKDKRSEEGKTIFDGIRCDALGRKISYFIRSGMDKTEPYVEYPAAAVIHVYKSRFPGQLRGIPEGFTGMNILHDMDDLHLLEMKAAKAAARITNVVTNAAGEFDPATLRRSKINIQSQDSAGNPTQKTVPEFYNVTLGGDTLALKVGEDIKQFCPTRPTVVTQQYWDLLTSLVCCGYNVPKLLVMPYSLQGTVTRADLDVCTNAFRSNFEIVKQAVRLIYEWQTQWAIRFDRSLDGNIPVDFLKSVIRPPRAPNVDVGKNAAALALELQIGTLTYQDIFAERQQDWRQQFRQSAEAEYVLQKLAQEFSKDGVVVAADKIAMKIEIKVTDPQKTEKDSPKEEATA